MDEVSEVIKLVIKLYNRGEGEGGEGCPEEFHFPADLLVVWVQGVSGWFLFFFLIPASQGWKENLDKQYLYHSYIPISNHSLGMWLLIN